MQMRMSSSTEEERASSFFYIRAADRVDVVPRMATTESDAAASSKRGRRGR
jgi:hypothetical protein